MLQIAFFNIHINPILGASNCRKIVETLPKNGFPSKGPFIFYGVAGAGGI